VHGDHEFGCIRELLSSLALTAFPADSHVGEVERSIRTIKERLRKRKINSAGVSRCKSYSTSPSVRLSTKVFYESRFGSLYPIGESRFGSLRVSVLIIVSRHCSSDIVKCSADKLMRSATASRAQKRTQTGTSPNAYFTCLIFQLIHLGCSIIQLTIYSSNSEEQPENRKNKENAASELLFNCSKFMFLNHFHSHN
jgi:hypothetical protein